MQKPPETFFNLEDFVPDLRQEFAQRPLNPKKIILAAIPVKNPDEHQTLVPAGMDRQSLSLTHGKEFWFWETDSLRALFRGNRQPPVLGEYPEAYNDSFILLDLHALEISKFFGDRRDAEMKEIYSSLRRRPGGRSRGFVHDYMWQAAALILSTRPLSQAEFEAIMSRLERSCRTFERGPTSRNYLAALRSTFGRSGDQN
jgi:hypothetical protein